MFNVESRQLLSSVALLLRVSGILCAPGCVREMPVRLRLEGQEWTS